MIKNKSNRYLDYRKSIVIFAVLLINMGSWVFSNVESRAEETPAVFPRADNPQKKFFVGEKLVYDIRYLGIPVGKAIGEVKDMTEVRGRKAYHIVVRVRSSKVVDVVFKVRDVHHTYIDAEKFYPVKYEKMIKEGKYRADEVMTYDQEKHTAHYLSRTNNSEKEMLVPPEVQDALSCGYWFRIQDIKPQSTVIIPVNADEKNWKLEVQLQDIQTMEIQGVGRFEALSAEPKVKFQGVFVKRGKISGWLSMDERRIPLRAKVKIPFLGSVIATLKKYEPGKA